MSLISIAKRTEFEHTEFAAFKTSIEEIVGKSLTWEIDLQSFDKTWDGVTYFFEMDDVSGSFHKYCFDRLTAVLTKLCATPLIKSIIAEKLIGIQISQRTDEEGMLGVYEFKDGIFIMKCAVNTNIGPVESEIEELMLQALNAMA